MQLQSDNFYLIQVRSIFLCCSCSPSTCQAAGKGEGEGKQLQCRQNGSNLIYNLLAIFLFIADKCTGLDFNEFFKRGQHLKPLHKYCEFSKYLHNIMMFDLGLNVSSTIINCISAGSITILSTLSKITFFNIAIVISCQIQRSILYKSNHRLIENPVGLPAISSPFAKFYQIISTKMAPISKH